MKKVLRTAKKVCIIIAGSAVLLVGLAMVVLPGPAIIVIPLGLGILSSEVPIARRWYRRGRVFMGRVLAFLKRTAKRVKGWFTRRPRRRHRHSRA